MKKIIVVIILFQLVVVTAFTQNTTTKPSAVPETKPALNTEPDKGKIKIYDVEADAQTDLSKAIQRAEMEEKHVLVLVGGNWCPWCVKFHTFITSDKQVDSIIKANYIVVKINYSKENGNYDVLKRLEFPQRFGFPVLVILDNNGRRIHTQDTGLLESGKEYDKAKVMRFLNNWTLNALLPKKYDKKE